MNDVNYNLMHKVHNELPKLAQRADLDKVFLLDWKGHTFNVLPYMCAGLSYFSLESPEILELRKTLTTYIDTPEHAEELREDLYIGLCDYLADTLSHRDFQIFYCLPVHASVQRGAIPSVAYYLYTKEPRRFLNVMLRIQSMLLYTLIMEERFFTHWDKMGNPQQGNKEAFSFYIGLKWLISVEPRYKMLLGKFLKRLNLQNYYDEFVPEGCFLDKVLKGEIADDDIQHVYFEPSFLDYTSLYDRDIIQSATDGAYDGHDLNKDMRDLITFTTNPRRKFMYGTLSLFDAFNMREHRDVSSEHEELKRNLEERELEYSKMCKSFNKQSDLLNNYKQEITQLTENNSALHAELKNHSTDDELHARLTQLEEELKEYKQENSRYEQMHLRDKQEISLLRKKVGKKEASAISDKLDVYESEVDFEDTIVKFEEKIAYLKDKKIVLIGLEDICMPTVQKMTSYGLEKVELYSSENTTPSRFDVCVVLSTRCKHRLTRKMETYAKSTNSLMLYSSSVNAKKVIELMYEYLSDENSKEE